MHHSGLQEQNNHFLLYQARVRRQNGLGNKARLPCPQVMITYSFELNLFLMKVGNVVSVSSWN